jgi:hypothetical protein
LILILTTSQHRYTHEELESEPGVDVKVMSYLDYEAVARHPPATCIFTDLDRLAPWGMQGAAKLYRHLELAGWRVLNDPARALGRFGLLRALNRAGINQFDAYRVDSLELPRKWPVFLRVEGDHSAPVSDLLADQQALDVAIENGLQEGFAKSALLIIEYAAEPVRPGLFRKYSVFKIGERLIGATCVHDDQWVVKYGKPGIAPPELYEEEYQFVAGTVFDDAVRRTFDIACVDYGRADFGLVGGQPQIYEINSNPDLKLRPPDGTVARRNETSALFRSNYLDALRALDSVPGNKAAARA